MLNISTKDTVAKIRPKKLYYNVPCNAIREIKSMQKVKMCNPKSVTITLPYLKSVKDHMILVVRSLPIDVFQFILSVMCSALSI